MKKKKQTGDQEIINLLAKKESFGLTSAEKQKLEELITENKSRKSLDKSIQQELRNVKTDGIIPNKEVFNSLSGRIESEKRINSPFYKYPYNFFTYKIPVYQAIGAAAAILFLFSGISTLSEKNIDKTYSKDFYFSQDIDTIINNDSSLIHIINIHSKGKSSAEDSSLTQFLVPAI